MNRLTAVEDFQRSIGNRQTNPRRRKGKMPVALARYWATHLRKRKRKSAPDAFLQTLARRRKRREDKRTAFLHRRRGNPTAKLYVLTAQRPGGRMLKYLGGIKFHERGAPALFRSATTARTVGKLLRLQFPVLKRYTMAVR